MTTRFKALTKVSALAAIAAIAAGSLVGCGEKEQAAAPAAAETAPLKVAFAYVGPVGDGGWTYAHDRARCHPGRVWRQNCDVLRRERT